MKSELRFYFAVFVRRLHYFLAVFVMVSAASLTVANILPPVYTSQTRLLVEAPQIPAELAAPTVRTAASESLEIIEQRLMTRINLLDIARSQNVFPDSRSMSADLIAKRMRKNTEIQRSAGRNRATMMLVSFSADRGLVAANVVNRYVTLILRDNAEIRTDRAEDTLRFFEIEVDRLNGELVQQSAAILEFKNQNTGALPESMDFRMSQHSVLQERIASVEREITSLKDQKRRLVQIFDTTGRITAVSNANISPEQRQMLGLQDQYRTALAIYSPKNPKVKLIEAQIARLESVLTEQTPTGITEDRSQTSILDMQLADIDSRMDILGEQRDRGETQLKIIRDFIDQTPAISIMLQSLDRDYLNIQQQYNLAVSRLAKAATGERIELLSKGQRITVLDPATVPEKPARPIRAWISIGGTVVGAILGFSLIALMEFLNTAVRRPVDIVSHLGITPIAVVPYIRTPMELVIRRAVFVFVFSLLMIGLPALIFAVHTYYLPLDLIYDRVAEKIGDML